MNWPAPVADRQRTPEGVRTLFTFLIFTLIFLRETDAHRKFLLSLYYYTCAHTWIAMFAQTSSWNRKNLCATYFLKKAKRPTTVIFDEHCNDKEDPLLIL